MDELKRKLIYLIHCDNMSWQAIYRILKKDPMLHSLYQLQIDDLIPPKTFKKSSLIPKPFLDISEQIHEQIRQYKTNNISIITIFDPDYPEILKQIYQPPWALFAKGDLSLLQMDPKLAVVGSRQVTQYGKNAIRLIFPGLIEKGVLIVSGLAKGVDALAHECALRNGGKTIAVIAGGFFHIYPSENKGLALKMMEDQLVLSEYPPDTKPTRWQFPMRNRIISGLSRGTLIIEAKRKSGSLITANYAVNEGRDVFSLPGSIFNPYSIGTNDLIQQGAKLVTSAGDILDELRI